MFGALYLPDFALQAALRNTPELRQQPAALLDEEEVRATILQITAPAAAAGVEAGMTASQALARCLSLTIKSRARGQEKIAGEILLHHAATLSPEIEATAPGVCTIHYTSRRDGRENLARVVRQLAALHLRAQAGLAATPDLSFLAACWPDPSCRSTIRQNSSRPLPLETLRHLLPLEKACHRSAVS